MLDYIAISGNISLYVNVLELADAIISQAEALALLRPDIP